MQRGRGQRDAYGGRVGTWICVEIGEFLSGRGRDRNSKGRSDQNLANTIDHFILNASMSMEWVKIYPMTFKDLVDFLWGLKPPQV